MTFIALMIAIAVGMGALAIGFYNMGFVNAGFWLAAFGIFWMVSQWRGWRWVSSAGLFIAVLSATFGLWFKFSFGFMVSGAIFALFAWDMTEFLQRLKFIAMDDNIRGMERRHIARVSLLTFAGLALASLATAASFQFTVEWGVFMVIVILVGLTQLIGWFRRQ